MEININDMVLINGRLNGVRLKNETGKVIDTVGDCLVVYFHKHFPFSHNCSGRCSNNNCYYINKNSSYIKRYKDTCVNYKSIW